MFDSSAEKYETIYDELPYTSFLVVDNLQQIDVVKRTDLDNLTSVNSRQSRGCSESLDQSRRYDLEKANVWPLPPHSGFWWRIR